MKRLSKKIYGNILLATLILLCVSCGGRDEFTQLATTQFFLQDFNPETIDVLWMVNDTSPMFRNRTRLIDQAKSFFARLDGAVSSDYQMAFVSADMQISNGALKPRGNPVILKKNLGTLDERTANFANILSQVINLQTGAEDRGLQSAYTALSLNFKPRAGVPLVIVFISDSDDKSPKVTADAVQEYADKFLELKGGNKELLRAYSINYLPLNGATRSDANRCATFDGADIDSAGFEDRYFKLAKLLSGDNATAGLCGSFSSQIDLAGVRIKELPKRFKLEKTPFPGSIRATVFKKGGKETIDAKWSYEPSTNEVVFDQTPPEGTTVQIIFLPSA